MFAGATDAGFGLAPRAEAEATAEDFLVKRPVEERGGPLVFAAVVLPEDMSD